MISTSVLLELYYLYGTKDTTHIISFILQSTKWNIQGLIHGLPLCCDYGNRNKNKTLNVRFSEDPAVSETPKRRTQKKTIIRKITIYTKSEVFKAI